MSSAWPFLGCYHTSADYRLVNSFKTLSWCASNGEWKKKIERLQRLGRKVRLAWPTSRSFSCRVHHLLLADPCRPKIMGVPWLNLLIVMQALYSFAIGSCCSAMWFIWVFYRRTFKRNLILRWFYIIQSSLFTLVAVALDLISSTFN